jgi:hypothetical protein
MLINLFIMSMLFCDLTCSPFLVDALDKCVLVTPRGGIYAR